MKQGFETQLSPRVETAGERLRTESVGEYGVPDYQPQVRRILRVRTRILPSGRYDRAGRSECAGLCVHTVLYSTDDGRLASLDVTSEYSFSFAAEEDALVLLLSPQIEGVSCRLVGPRRITVRTTLALTPHVYRPSMAEKGGGDARLDSTDTVRLTHPLWTTRLDLPAPSELALSDSVAIESGTELLLSDAAAEITETRIGASGAEVKGEIRCTALLSGEGAVPYFLSHRIPFETFIACDTSGGAELCAYPTVTAFEARISSGDGGGSRLFLDVGLTLDAELVTPCLQKVVVDAFSLKSPLVAVKESIPVTEILGGCRHRAPFGCSISRSESDSEDACAVIDLGVTPQLRSQERVGDRLLLRGECRIDAALLLGSSDAEGRAEYSTTSFSSPFEISLPLRENLPEDAELEIFLSVFESSGRLEAATLSAQGEMVATVRATRRRMISPVTAMTEGDPAPGRGPSESEIVAIYPGADESLWSIAKRYRVSPEQIARANALASESLENADLPSSIDGRAVLLLMQ